MGKKIADLLIKLGADTYGFTKMRGDVKKQLDGLGKDLQGLGKSMSLYVTAPLMATAGAAVHLADVQMRAEAKVQQAIKSTGGAAKLNFKQLKKYASELQGKTVFGDEKILNESTAQLLTFTNISGENFKRVQQAALDVATVLDGDLKSTTIQLGKALNDPVKNLSALSRSGIQFSKDQIALIKSLAETNRLADAQSIILDELNRQYGGQAEAAAKIGLGSFRQLQNSLGDLGEELGTILMPMVQKVVGWVQNFVTWLQNLSPATKTAIVVVGGLAAAIGPLSLGLGTIIRMLPLLAGGFAALFSTATLVAGAVAALAYGLVKLLSSTSDAEKANKKLKQSFSETESAVASERYQIDQLFGRLKAAKEGSYEYADAKQRIIDKYGVYLSKLGDEKTALNDIAAAYKTVVEEATRAIHIRALDTVVTNAADDYAAKKSEVYDSVKKMLERKFKGQKTAEGIDLSAYYLMKLKPVIMDEASVTKEIQDIIKEFNVERIVSGTPGSGMGQTVKISNKLNDLLQSVNTAKKIADDAVAAASAKWGVSKEDVKEQIGLLGQLQERLTSLETKRGMATTPEEIAAINIQIAETREEIEKLNSVGLTIVPPDSLGLIEEIQKKLSDLERAKKAAANTFEIYNLTKAIEEAQKKLDELFGIGTSKGIGGNADSLLGGGISPLRFDPNAIIPPDSDWTDARNRLHQNMVDLQEDVSADIITFATLIAGLAESTAIGIAEGLGNMLGGDGTFDDILASFGKTVGQFLVSVGKQLIMTSKIIEVIKTALANIWSTPLVGIVAGVAAVAAGQALIASFNRRAEKGVALANGGLAYGPTMALVGDNKGAGYDPEVIAPLSKLRQYGLGRQTIEFVGGQLRLSGSDLLLSIRREDAKINYINALT